MAQLKRYSSITGDDGHPDDLHFELEVVFREPGPEFRKPPIEETYDPPLPPVDGGIKAWSSIAGGFLALFVQFGLGKWRSGQNPIPNSRSRTASMHTLIPMPPLCTPTAGGNNPAIW